MLPLTMSTATATSALEDSKLGKYIGFSTVGRNHGRVEGTERRQYSQNVNSNMSIDKDKIPKSLIVYHCFYQLRDYLTSVSQLDGRTGKRSPTPIPTMTIALQTQPEIIFGRY
ncbi:hypothetical protein FPOAC2_07240 [Fusarium poae]|jgi:hypothetical protein